MKKILEKSGNLSARKSGSHASKPSDIKDMTEMSVTFLGMCPCFLRKLHLKKKNPIIYGYSH